MMARYLLPILFSHILFRNMDLKISFFSLKKGLAQRFPMNKTIQKQSITNEKHSRWELA